MQSIEQSLRALCLGIMLCAALFCSACISQEEVKMDLNEKGLSSYVGLKVTVTGRVSEMPWQHMIDVIDTHPHVFYLDWDNDQTVVYCTKPVECTGDVIVEGTVILLEGKSKRPGSEQSYSEYQIKADDIKCREEV